MRLPLVLLVAGCTTAHGFVVPACRAQNALSCSTFVARTSAKHAGAARFVRPRASTAPRMMFEQLAEKLTGISEMLQGKKKITAASIERALGDVKRALLDADVNLKVCVQLAVHCCTVLLSGMVTQHMNMNMHTLIMNLRVVVDVLQVTNDLIESVRKKAVGMLLVEGVTPDQQFIKIMYDELVLVMGTQQTPLVRR
jgi:signal recognition particle GTPase